MNTDNNCTSNRAAYFLQARMRDCPWCLRPRALHLQTCFKEQRQADLRLNHQGTYEQNTAMSFQLLLVLLFAPPFHSTLRLSSTHHARLRDRIYIHLASMRREKGLETEELEERREMAVN